MKYVLIAIAVLAAGAALYVRPPFATQREAEPAAPNSATSIATPAAQGRVAAHVPERRRIVVYVAGAVKNPGVYAFAPEARAQEAVARAGGAQPDADLVAVNLAAPLGDGMEVVVPKTGAEPPSTRRRAGGRTGSTRAKRGRRHRSAASPRPLRERIDLNAANADELQSVPGIGPALAERIVAFRATNGPFASLDELADVAGITPRLQDELSEFVTVP